MLLKMMNKWITKKQTLDAMAEWKSFVKLAKTEAHTKLKAEGHDLSVLEFTIIQPYTSGHYFALTFSGVETRTVGILVNAHLEEFEAVGEVLYTLKEKDGKLDILQYGVSSEDQSAFLDDIQEQYNAAQAIANARKQD